MWFPRKFIKKVGSQIRLWYDKRKLILSKGNLSPKFFERSIFRTLFFRWYFFRTAAALLFAFNSIGYKWITYFRKGFILKMSIMDFHCTRLFLHRHTFVYRKDFVPINWYKSSDRIRCLAFILRWHCFLFAFLGVFLGAWPFLRRSIQIAMS